VPRRTPQFHPGPFSLTNLHIGYSSPGEYDRPDHSAKVGQEAKELLWVVGRDSSGARQSTNIDAHASDATSRVASALETQKEIFKVVGL
jgi:hypothetical protein